MQLTAAHLRYLLAIRGKPHPSGHQRKITMKVLTMQLNSVTLMDLMAYGGAGWASSARWPPLRQGQLTLTATLTIVLLAADFSCRCGCWAATSTLP